MTKKSYPVGSEDDDTTQVAVSQDTLNDILATVNALKAKLEQAEEEKTILAQKAMDAERTAKDATRAATQFDPAYKPSVLSPGMVTDLGDRPAISVEEKLQALENLAKENNDDTFDKERARRKLLGLPVEPEITFLCMVCGTAPEPQTEEAYNAHSLKHELEAGRTIGKRGSR